MKDNANPLHGWAYADYKKYAQTGKADEYGALFFFLRNLFYDFCLRLRKERFDFQMLSIDALALQNFVGSLKFDRIEVRCSASREGSLTETSVDLQPVRQR